MSKLFVCCLILFCTLPLTCPIELLARFSFVIASMLLLSQRYLITRYPLILVGFSCSVAPNSHFQSLPEFRNNGFSPACCHCWCYYCREKKKEKNHPRCRDRQQYPQDRPRQAWVGRKVWQELYWLCGQKWHVKKSNHWSQCESQAREGLGSAVTPLV